MIDNRSKDYCCGCGACVQKCQKQCISLQEDNEGFLYPRVDTETCIDCGFCEKVCPMLSPYQSRKPQQVLAAINKDEKIRMESSSGGIFTLLAEKVINEGGVVFGARFDEEWQVTIDYTETIEGLAAFRGSKYVQARTGDAYKLCEKFLRDERQVLFSATPCQIAALKHSLRKDYPNLITVACACHGAPSPLVWKYFLLQVSKGRTISEVKFRDKSTGWKHYSFTITFANGEVYTDDALNVPYMKGFVKALIERPACEKCKFKNGKSGADVILADHWGITLCGKIENDDKGCSLALIYNKSLTSLLNIEKVRMVELNANEIGRNGAFLDVIPQHGERGYFFENITRENCVELLSECLKPSRGDKLAHCTKLIKSYIRKIVK